MLDLAAREFEAASALKPGWTLPRMRLARIRQGLPTLEAGHPPVHATMPAREGR